MERIEYQLDARGKAVIRPLGPLGREGAAELYRLVLALSKDTAVTAVVLDAAAMGPFASAEVAVLALAPEMAARGGKKLGVINLSPGQEAALQMAPGRRPPRLRPAEPHPVLMGIGEGVHGVWDRLAQLVELIVDTGHAAWRVMTRRGRLPPGAVAEQAEVIGVDALLIVGLLSFLLGLIMAFQSAYQLQQFGANIYVANLVGISMVREFGPMMTAVMVAGRSGSAIAAELGSMTVQEEVDALRTMGLNPVEYLVLPRLWALVLVQPALTVLSMLAGVMGGLVIAASFLELPVSLYFRQTMRAVTIWDFANGMGKSVVFAAVIGLTACHSGLRIEGGASGVGRATTQAVVVSIFLIIVADSIFATISTLLKYA